MITDAAAGLIMGEKLRKLDLLVHVEYLLANNIRLQLMDQLLLGNQYHCSTRLNTMNKNLPGHILATLQRLKTVSWVQQKDQSPEVLQEAVPHQGLKYHRAPIARL